MSRFLSVSTDLFSFLFGFSVSLCVPFERIKGHWQNSLRQSSVWTVRREGLGFSESCVWAVLVTRFDWVP